MNQDRVDFWPAKSRVNTGAPDDNAQTYNGLTGLSISLNDLLAAIADGRWYEASEFAASFHAWAARVAGDVERHAGSLDGRGRS